MTALSERSDAAENCSVSVKVPLGCQVLIVGDDANAGQLEAALHGGRVSAAAPSTDEPERAAIGGANNITACD